MTDTAPAEAGTPAEPPSPVAAPTGEAAPAVAAPTEPPAAATESEAGAKAHGFASLEDAVAEVTKVRQEAANRRVALKPYEEAFGQFDDESRGIYLDLAKQIASGDPAQQKAAAARFREIAERIEGSEVGTKPTGEVDPDNQPLTRKELRELQEQAEHERQIQDGIKQIEADAEKAGIPINSPRYASYLWALQQPDVAGDHEKALALLKADQQSVVDAYAASVAAGTEKWPGVVPAGAGPGEPAEAPKTFKEARKMAQALIKGRAGEVTT